MRLTDVAKEVLTIVRDDLDASEGAEPIEFAIDGQLFTIDLSERNAAALREALAVYVAAATPIPWSDGVSRPKSAVVSHGPMTAVYRSWWRNEENIQRYELPPWNDRGRIPGSVVDAYAEANR